MSEKLFRKKSLDKVSSPEQLNDYIRVANPSVWLIMGAILALLIAVLVWAAWSELPTSINSYGVAEGGRVVCFLTESDAATVEVGMEARVGEAEGQVAEIVSTPMSRDEVNALFDTDYEKYAVNASEWNVKIVLSVPEIADGGCEASIITNSVRPLDFLLN